MKTLVLYGNEVRLRPIEERDAAILVKFAKDPAMAPNLTFFSERPPTFEEELAWIRNIRKGIEEGSSCVFTVETADGKNFIGTVGLHEIDHRNKNARVGILIFNMAMRGRGYAPEILSMLYDYAFDILSLRKLYMSFRTDNERQKRLARSLGYRRVGILKEEYFWRGKFLDFVRYELLASDWIARRNREGAPKLVKGGDSDEIYYYP